ncbi:hypothetical protein [Vibrio parahaemolyticus]|nr:hypothetical protein [Vibrio parahaemolyticus]HCZ9306309.1 hypothetical protein [Vibrio alginolyticus]MBM5118050.1 hypothetical protein [Vibrio parahaemolyticus]MBM5121428.1 hypothetical protein [Vibrio parahaemolyticus]MBM5131842.1 hypothetical protein [Vibrio parahaemolyticus]MBM5138573.1 hypothetical protein [Vibrio parahaemolyticus]
MTKNVILQDRYELAKKVMQDPEHTQTYLAGWRRMELRDIPRLKLQKEFMKISKELREGFRADIRGLVSLAERLKA